MQVTPVFNRIREAYNASQYNIIVLEGGSRSSKTHSLIQFWILWAQVHQNDGPKRVLVARLKSTWTKATVYYDFLNVLKAYGLYDKKNENKTQSIYRLFETEFWFSGLDDQQKIHGLSTDAFWINEAIEAGNDDFDQLEQRCKGFGILDYNPSVDEHWIYDKVCKRPDAKYIHSTMLDNPFIPENSRRKILSYEPTPENYAAGTADKNKWEIYGLGLRAKLEGVVYENWDTVPFIPDWVVGRAKHRWGLDFGFTNDPTALPDVYWFGNEIWVDELVYETNLLNQQIGKRIIQFGLSSVKGWADRAEPKSIEEIHKMGINIHGADKPPGSVRAGIDILKSYKIHFTERSINGIKEIKNYKWMQDKNGKYLNEPIDDYNHLMDALRYVAFMEMGVERKKQNLSGMFR